VASCFLYSETDGKGEVTGACKLWKCAWSG
jgi:hypothetical protein